MRNAFRSVCVQGNETVTLKTKPQKGASVFHSESGGDFRTFGIKQWEKLQQELVCQKMIKSQVVLIRLQEKTDEGLVAFLLISS